MTIERLEQLNLSPQQSKLYLAALEVSPASVATLAKNAGIERTAAYPHLEELVSLGLLSIKPEKERRLYVAQSPKVLGSILDSKKETYQKLLPELMSAFNTKGFKPTVRYYEGQEGIRTAMHNTLLSGSKLNFHLMPINNAMKVLGEEFSRRYIEERVKRGIKTKSLRVKEDIAGPWEVRSQDESLLRELRFLPSDFKLEESIIIHSDTVTIISSVHENYGLEIESKEFADTMRSFFNIVWQVAERK